MMATKLAEVNGAPGSRATTLKVNQEGGLATVRCTLTGTTPLLMNAMPRDTLLSLALPGYQKPAKTKERPEARDAAETHVYRLTDGRPCVPTRMLYAALINAGVFVRLDGKRQVSTKNETNLPGLMSLVSAELPLYLPGTDDSPDFEVDIQQGRNPNGGEAVCIIRPCFHKWEVRADFQVDRQVFPLESARQLVEIAGRRMGIGDFRPQRRGTFGQFAISRWDVS